jgi:tetratricopeptide (TPR) repeat protein
VIPPKEMRSDNGEQFTVESDGGVFVSGPNPMRAVYTIQVRNPLPAVFGLRIETLPDARLPQGGAGRYPGNGNFHLAELTVAVAPRNSADAPTQIELAWIAADGQQSKTAAPGNMIDGDPKTRWEVHPRHTQPHAVTIALKTPVPSEQGDLVLTLDSGISTWGRHGLGRFRISVSGDSRAFEQEQNRRAAQQLTDPWARLVAAYRLLGQEERAADVYSGLIDYRRNNSAAPDQVAQALRLRGAHHVRAGQWKLAAADYYENVTVDPRSTSIDWMTAAALWAYAADSEQHRLHCEQMAERFRESTVANDMERTVKVSMLLGPGLASDPATAAKFLESVAKTEDAGSLKWFLSAKALLACRNGDFSAAQQSIGQSLELLKAGGDAPGSTASLMARSVQALIFARQGDATRAQVALDELKSLLATKTKLKWQDDGTLDGVTLLNGDRVQHDWLIPEILRREAVILIGHNADTRR